MRPGGRRPASIAAAVALVVAFLVGSPQAPPEPSVAVVGSQFQAGNIISDAVFYNSGSMSEAQVQSFLEQRVPSCLAGYVCLRDYRENTTNQSAKVEGCAAYTGRSSQSAASIISSVATACGINPQSLIVLLEKEQGLVSDSSPSSRQYRSATGYGCPDTADCDIYYYGFFNQVYNAAWQFKKYQYNPGGRSYQAGRVNTILWHPNTACGSSQVYIENQATAGLYLYTPYRPNAAALANLYGTGDACSAYGNRNFWRIFNDWFGPTTAGGNLVRTLENPTVYLIAGSTKHPIGDLETFNAYAPLGPLGYVAQSYLDGLSTGRQLGRLVGDDAGTLYFVDGGAKYRFDTCARVFDFGYNCPDYVRLTPGQVSALSTGAGLTGNISTPNGLYHIDDGRRAQAIDAAALAAAGFSERTTPLTAASLDRLAYATPIMRDDVYVRQAGTSTYGLWFSGALAPVSTGLHATGPLGARLGVRQLDPGAFALLARAAELSPIVEDATGADFALTPTGRVRLDGVGFGAVTRLSAGILNALPVGPERIAAPSGLKAPDNVRVYFVGGGMKRPLPEAEDWDAARTLMPDPRVVTVTSTLLERLPTGPAWIRPASLVKSADSDRVFLVDGAMRHHIAAMADLQSLPPWPVRTLEGPIVASLTEGAPYSTFLSCSGSNWLTDSGLRYATSTEMRTRYGLAQAAPPTLEDTTCARIPKASAPLTEFLRNAGDSAIYVVQDGRKRHVVSGSVLDAIRGATPITTAGAGLFQRLATSSPRVAVDPAIVPVFVQVTGQQAVLLVDGSSLRRIATWDDYLFRASTASDVGIYGITAATVAGFSTGPDYLRPGSIARAASASEVYLLDADGKRRYIPTMEIPKALGAPALQVTSASTIAASADAGTGSTWLRCGSTDAIGLGGALYPVPTGLRTHFTGTYVAVSDAACRSMRAATKPLSRFLRAPSGDLYLIDLGAKRHILTMATFAQLGGTADALIGVSDYSLTTFPTGAPLP